MKRTLSTLISLGLCCASSWGQSNIRSLDFGWRFTEQDITEGQTARLDDSSWQVVDLPHDWDIYHAPYADAPSEKAGGYFPGGKGWYRKQMKDSELKVTHGESLWLHFEGV